MFRSRLLASAAHAGLLLAFATPQALAQQPPATTISTMQNVPLNITQSGSNLTITSTGGLVLPDARTALSVAGGGTSITTSGTISSTGGLAIDLGAGVNNSLTITGGSITGGVSTTGNSRLTFNPGTLGFFLVGSAFSGFGATEIQSGNVSVLTTGSISGNLTLSGGSLNIGRSDAISAGTISFLGGTLTTSATMTLANTTISLPDSNGTITPSAGTTLTISNLSGSSALTGTGNLTMNGQGTLLLGATSTGSNSFGGTLTLNSGTLTMSGGPTNPGLRLGTASIVFNGGAIAGPGNSTTTISNGITVNAGGGSLSTIGDNGVLNVTGAISGAGALTITGGRVNLSGANTAHAGGVTVNSGATLGLDGSQNLGGGAVLRLNGGTLSLGGSLANPITLGVAGGTIFNTGSLSLTGVISGNGGLTKTGSGTVILTGANTYSGGTTVTEGTLTLFGAGRLGSGALSIASGATAGIASATADSSIAALSGAGTLVLGSRSLTITAGSGVFSGVISNGAEFIGAPGGLTVTGGTTTLSGTNTYTGATLVQGGVLVVNGSIARSSSLTVSGGQVQGTGSLPSLTLTGGTLAPGNSVGTLTVNGSLTLGAGSTTAIEVQGATADRINVTGAVTLGGTLQLLPLGGSYSFNAPYTIIQAASVAGSFATVTTSGSFGAGVTPSVTTTATQVQLTLAPALLLGGTTTTTGTGTTTIVANPALPGFNTYNLRSTAGALDLANRAGANLTPFFAIYNQSAANITQAVNQLSGENATAIPAIGFTAGEQLLTTLLDPLAYGRESQVGLRLKPEQNAEGAPAPQLAVWGAATGGYNRTNGDAGDGSASRTTRAGGFAIGLDAAVTPETVAGVAIAVGEATASLSGGMGRVESNFGQVALHGTTRLGEFTLAAATALTVLDIDTSRRIYALGNDRQNGNTTAQVYSLRTELRHDGAALGGGFRLLPVAGFQLQATHSEGYTESSPTSGRAYSLTVPGQTNTAIRTEMGAQAQGGFEIGGQRVRGFARVAWAHYLTRDAAMDVRFASLPGGSFNIRGARPDPNSALFGVGLEIGLMPGVTLGARLDGELSGNVQQYSVTGRVRYAF